MPSYSMHWSSSRGVLRAPLSLTTGPTMMLLDMGAMLAIWPIAFAVVISQSPHLEELQIAFLGMLYPAINLVFLYALGMYRRDTMATTRKALGRTPFVAAMGALGGFVLAAILDWSLFPGPDPLAGRTWLLLTAVACFTVAGIGARLCFRLLRERGVIRRRLLVVGAGRRAWDLAHMLQAEGRNLNYGLVFAHASTLGEIDPRLVDGSTGEIVSLSKPELLKTALEHNVDQIVVAPDERRGMVMMDLLACKTSGFPVTEYLTFIEAETRRIDLKRLEISWLLYSEGFYFGLFDRAFKRMLDIVSSVVMLIPAMPLLLLGMAAIKLDDGGPVFYRQTRVTRGSREFGIMKLRTMTVNAEATGAVWAAAKDSRITRIGNFLRRSRIDELPQLFNVLRGDMSLVGPRPERPGFVGMLEQEIPLYNERHLVKAGLTGWAQVNYPYGASVNDARSKLCYDLYYIKNFNVMFDILIILQTLRVVLWPGNTVR